jgi:YegS/Rv2252/BmrU family lipid kinase
MRLALLQNPESGSGDASDVAALLRDAGADVEGFALDQPDRAVEAKPDRIVVAGGDGSIGCGADAAVRAGVPLAVVPVGTANDFARAMDIPDDLAEAVTVAASGRDTRHHDLGRMDGRAFVNVASLGLPPAAAERAHGLKGALGPAAYAVGGVRAAASADPIHCVARCDGREVFAGDAWQVTVACSGSFGAGSEVSAEPHDGQLDLVAFEAGSRLALARRALGLRRGTVESQDGVHSFRGARIELEVPHRTGFNVDGEVVESGPVDFTIDPRSLEVVVG